MAESRFPSPFEVEAPDGIEGWEELYPYSVVFSEERRSYEDDRFWFWDSMHWGSAMTPWDSTFLEMAIASLSQFNSRHYRIPPADGIDFRVLYGYPYFSPVTIEDGSRIESRVPDFVERAGHYFANWDQLYDNWLGKIRATIDEITAINLTPLPEMEDLEVITSGLGTGTGHHLQVEYRRFKDLCLQVWQYHFEFLNLGYAAYLDFFGFCKQAWPSIPDLGIAKMVAGVEVDLFRPNEELKVLARKAIDGGLARVFDTPNDVAAIRAAVAETDFEAHWNDVSDPWFNFSSGTGFYHYDKTWCDYPEIPYAFIKDYIAKIEAGEDITRPIDAIRAERDRVVEEYGDLLQTDEDRQAFQEKLGLARVVFPYVENHNFYIEHWTMSVIWRKLRELGQMLLKEDITTAEDDVFYFRRDEIDEVLWDIYSGWAVNAPTRGPGYWPPRIARRREIVDRFRAWQPPKALGEPPDVVTEPFTIMLWGITSDSVQGWLGAEEGADELTGMAASPGIVEGPARLVFNPEDIGDIADGEILVSPITAPSWAPVFPKIQACVTDIGGMMSHAAIVCREYGIPAVTGTGFGTREIKTGDLIRVDGSAGTVTKLE
ncbi:MAG: PEP-utilizing enzyme [Acidimicrobiia bacterium]|nr:PEP-utilizing enzyme [Acidimicrobiia bacterium]